MFHFPPTNSTSPCRRSIAWRVLVLVLLCASLLSGPANATSSTPEAAGDFAHYDLEVSFDPESRTLAGSVTVEWVNTTGQPHESIYFRLYPNAAHYVDGETDVTSVTVDGRSAESAPWPDATVFEVETGRPVAPGDEVEIAFAFVTTIPTTSGASFGILGGDPETGWRLADWYPILAGWEAGSGWYLDPPTRFGDPTFAESATYELTFTGPDEYLVIGSGVTTGATGGPSSGIVTTAISTAPARDLTLSLLPGTAATPHTATREIGGITVRVTLPEEEAIPGLAETVLSIAADTLPLYESWLGAYPEGELDITSVPLAGAGGVSWSGIVWLDIEPVAEDGQLAASERERLRFVLAHELSHQWLPGVIGSNNNDHGFMTEGLANALGILAIREVSGAEEAERYLRSWVASGYRGMLASGQDGIADAPIADDTDIAARAHLVYGKAALGFEAIRQEIGDAAFFAGLAAYANDYRFAVSTPGDLRHAFEGASGVNLEPLWQFWFEERETTAADVDAVLDGFATSPRHIARRREIPPALVLVGLVSTATTNSTAANHP